MRHAWERTANITPLGTTVYPSSGAAAYAASGSSTSGSATSGDSAAATDGASQSVAVTAHAGTGGGLTFHELLSELNPLQYLPVVGTIYRSVTGDTIPESVRAIGSMIVSGLMGGPIGVAMNIGMLAAEKATGIDPEQIGQHLLADLGIGGDDKVSVTAAVMPSDPAAAASAATTDPAQTGAAATAAASTTAPAAPAADAAPKAWSPTQLAAYGVTTNAHGVLQRGALQGADVLNDLELARHGVQFAAAQPTPVPPAGAASSAPG